VDARLAVGSLPEVGGCEPLEVLTLVGRPAQLDRLMEGKLGAGQETNRRCLADGIVDLFKSDRATAEIMAYQFVGNDCRTRFGVLKAKVAHIKPLGLVAGDKA